MAQSHQQFFNCGQARTSIETDLHGGGLFSHRALASMTIRILVVEGVPMVAERVAALSGEYCDLELVQAAATAADALVIAARLQPDVALIDRELPDCDGIELCDRLRLHAPDAALIILSAENSDQLRLHAVESGACGIIPRLASDPDVIEAILRAAEGEFLFSRSVTLRLFRKERELRGHAEPSCSR
jgi:DNA-binding NarL/FixJ family response regulator